MKVIKTKKMDGCFESSNARDIMLDGIITFEFIQYLGKLGKLIYNDKINNPFFIVMVRGKCTIKGSQGNKSIRVLLPVTFWEEIIEELKEFIEKYGEELN